MKHVLFSFFLCLAFHYSIAQSNYFGSWKSGNAVQQTRVTTSLSTWNDFDEDFVFNQGLRLKDFEHYVENGQDYYFGSWQTGTGVQEWRLLTNYSDWVDNNNSFFFDSDLRLTDFEHFEEGGQDFFFGSWNTGTGTQVVRLSNTIADWTVDNNNFVNNLGLQLYDFEYFQEGGQSNFFGCWRPGTGIQQIRIATSLAEWQDYNEDLVQNQGLILYDFEYYVDGGQEYYFGLWRTDPGVQAVEIAPTLLDWANFDNDYINNQGMNLEDFEFFSSQVPISCNYTGDIEVNGLGNQTACDDLVRCFMDEYGIPAASFALSKNGKMIYSKSFGKSDLNQTQQTQTHNLFRIASVSKPITAVAIMKLQEEGLLNLSDKVFGVGGILGGHADLQNANIQDPRIYDITVQNLLEHSGGWDRSVDCFPNPTSPYPWQFSGCDPIVAPLHVSEILETNNPTTEANMIQFLLEHGLDFSPGTDYAYSNIGFLILGEVIASITNMDYEQYVQSAILSPLGICDMHMAKNLLAEKQEREVEYHGNGGSNLSCYGTGEFVPWEYGGFNIEAMDAHGGWIATASDLQRFILSVDGSSSPPDILNANSISSMTSPSMNNSNYAKGWTVNSSNNWWHTGSLDGTASFIARTENGYSWSILLNKRAGSSESGSFWNDFDNLPWECISNLANIPTYDLLENPENNSSDLAINIVDNSTVNISWTVGTGTDRLVLLREGQDILDFPIDGQNYAAIPVFGIGQNLGNDTYAIYNGSGNNVDVNGLNPNTNYTVRVFDYNNSAETGGHNLYKLCDDNSLYFEITDSDNDGFIATYDCDDLNADINPNGVEICNGLDDDCDGLIDNEDSDVIGETVWYLDNDNDGFGNALQWIEACIQPAGYVLNDNDCNDSNENIFPGALEICNGIDDDCDGFIDDSDPDITDQLLWYADADLDGFGDADNSMLACNQPPNFVLNSLDCDDNNDAINPNGIEICNNIDDNCDGLIDDLDSDVQGQSVWYADNDQDGFGDPNNIIMSCFQPPSTSTDNTDCDDNDSMINSSAQEICNGIDDDCDGLIDVDDPDVTGTALWYEDLDNDGFGNPNVFLTACAQPTGYVINNIDCDDNNNEINPDAIESCNGIDDNCNGLVDGDDPNIQGQTIFFADTDGDGFGDPQNTMIACTLPTGFSTNQNDCDDSNPEINPDSTESCNGIDDDCDGLIDSDDENVEGELTWYADTDGDGFGDELNILTSCEQPTGYTNDLSDCDDTDSSINPDAIEIVNNEVDENCDGIIGTTRVLEFGDSELKIFPNPTKDYIYLESEYTGSVIIKILDIKGQFLDVMSVNKIPKTINFTEYKAGVYLLEIRSASNQNIMVLTRIIRMD